MTTGAEHIDRSVGRPFRRKETLDEQLRRRGIRPVRSVGDMARDVFESDDELELFWRTCTPSGQANQA